jgi:hypothetical protein
MDTVTDNKEKGGILIKIKEFFGFASLQDFKAEWSELSEKDRTDLRKGIADGSMTY